MRDVILRPDAAADIENASDYTIARWGHEQAHAYVGELRQAIESLASTALRHPLCDSVYPGLRRKRSGMHHIYFVAWDDRVEILNGIHVQRDPGLHLKTEAWRDEEPDGP